jgi:hypothetical protein
MVCIFSALWIGLLPGADGNGLRVQPAWQRFAIDAKVLEALEGGPLVVRATLV